MFQITFYRRRVAVHAREICTLDIQESLNYFLIMTILLVIFIIANHEWKTNEDSLELYILTTMPKTDMV